MSIPSYSGSRQLCRGNHLQARMLQAFKQHDYKLVCLSMGLDYEKLRGRYPSTSQCEVGLDKKLHEMCSHWGNGRRGNTTKAYGSIQNGFLVSILQANAIGLEKEISTQIP